jgi:hypothetical protein
MLWYLTEAERLCPRSDGGLSGELAAALDALDAIAAVPVPALARIDLASHERTTRALLRRLGMALGGRREGSR